MMNGGNLFSRIPNDLMSEIEIIKAVESYQAVQLVTNATKTYRLNSGSVDEINFKNTYRALAVWSNVFIIDSTSTAQRYIPTTYQSTFKFLLDGVEVAVGSVDNSGFNNVDVNSFQPITYLPNAPAFNGINFTDANQLLVCDDMMAVLANGEGRLTVYVACINNEKYNSYFRQKAR